MKQKSRPLEYILTILFVPEFFKAGQDACRRFFTTQLNYFSQGQLFYDLVLPPAELKVKAQLHDHGLTFMSKKVVVGDLTCLNPAFQGNIITLVFKFRQSK